MSLPRALSIQQPNTISAGHTHLVAWQPTHPSLPALQLLGLLLVCWTQAWHVLSRGSHAVVSAATRACPCSVLPLQPTGGQMEAKNKVKLKHVNKNRNWALLGIPVESILQVPTLRLKRGIPDECQMQQICLNGSSSTSKVTSERGRTISCPSSCWWKGL